MKLLPRLLVITLLAFGSLRAADSSIDFKADATIANILRQQAGQVVELRLTSGEKIGGKVDKVGDSLVHLTQLTGQEFFEAVVDLESVSAVVVRSKSK